MWGLEIRQCLFEHHSHYSGTVPVFLSLCPLLGAERSQSPGKGLWEGLGVLLAWDRVQFLSPSLPGWKGAPGDSPARERRLYQWHHQ